MNLFKLNQQSMLLISVILITTSAWSYVESTTDASFSTLISKAKNESLPMSQRWDALIKSSEVAEGQQIAQVLEFTKNKNWFMRNAVLVALDKMGTDLVYDKAKILISDKALVVRSAAVDILTRLDNAEVRSLLSKELNRNYNFVGKSSLWIRPQIMKSLIKNPYQSEKGYFSRLLFDQDKQITEMSMVALEKITQIRYEGDGKLEHWKKLAKDKRWF